MPLVPTLGLLIFNAVVPLSTDIPVGEIWPVFVGPGLVHGFLVAPGKTRRDEFIITVERGPLNIQRIEGDLKKISARLETVEPGKQYAVYLRSSKVVKIELPQGKYQGEWLDALSGQKSAIPAFIHHGGIASFMAPRHFHDCALRLTAK